MSQSPAMRAAEVVIANQTAEIERLKTEGSPGVLHEVDQAFYDLTVRERDLERQRVDRLTAEIEVLRAAALPRTDDRGYDLRQRFNRAVRWLRDAEDIARTEMPAWPTADRIRDIYEQITDDLLNGKTTVPPLKQRLAEAGAEIERLRSYVDDRMNREQGYDPPFKSRNLCLCEHRCGDVFEAEDDPRRSVCKGLPRKR